MRLEDPRESTQTNTILEGSDANFARDQSSKRVEQILCSKFS